MPGLHTAALALLAALPLSAVAQTPLISPNSEPSGRFGEAVSSLGEANGDGVRDVLVGAPGESAASVAASGRAYIISGADQTALLTLQSPAPEAGGRFGAALDSGGDLTSDGVPDPIVGAPGETAAGQTRAGRAYVFSGSDGALLFTLESPYPTAFGLFGASLARIPDTNGDGVNDIVVGAPQERGDPAAPNAPNSGGYHVFSGATGALLESGTFSEEDARLGAAVGWLDVDGDGTPEVLASVPGRDASGAEFVGAVTVGAASPPYLVPPTDTENLVFGQSLDVVGDRDGDDVGEVLVGAEDSVYVFSGATGALLYSVGSPEAEGGGFGFAAAGAGNVDETGAADLIVGAFAETARGIATAGRVYLFSGDDARILSSYTSPNAEPLGQFGFSVALAGAVDDDNTADQIVGAPGENDGAGRAYLLLSATAVASEPTPERTLALTASPNPARGSLRLGTEAGTPGTLTVVDALGREVYSAEIRATTTLDVSAWAPGLYLARLATEAGTVTREITVVR